MNEVQQNIENQNLSKPLVFDANNIKSGYLKIEVEGYPLQESDFETIIRSDNTPREWAFRLLFGAIGYLIILIVKIIEFIIAFGKAENKNNVTSKIGNYEWIIILVLILSFIVLISIGKYSKTRKDKLVIKIRDHFKSAKNV